MASWPSLCCTSYTPLYMSPRLLTGVYEAIFIVIIPFSSSQYSIVPLSRFSTYFVSPCSMRCIYLFIHRGLWVCRSYNTLVCQEGWLNFVFWFFACTQNREGYNVNPCRQDYTNYTMNLNRHKATVAKFRVSINAIVYYD